MVDAGNGKFNLMILCWGEGHGSAIHDHADSHCFMKILKGQLREMRYAWPKNNNNNNNVIAAECNGSADSGGELQELSRSLMDTNSVFYINGTGIERRRNAPLCDMD